LRAAALPSTDITAGRHRGLPTAASASTRNERDTKTDDVANRRPTRVVVELQVSVHGDLEVDDAATADERSLAATRYKVFGRN